MSAPSCSTGGCPLVRLYRWARTRVSGNGTEKTLISAIGPDEVGSWQERNARLIDVREAWEFKAGHIPAARNMPLSSISKQLDGKLKPDGRPVVLICASGARSGRAARLLAKHGFDELANLTGGTNAWARQGLPISKGH